MESHQIDYNDNYVIIADVHGNYDALRAIIIDALNTFGIYTGDINEEIDISKFKSRIKGFIFLGDNIGDFPFGDKVVKLINSLKENYEVYAIAGNRETGMARRFYEATKGHYKNGRIDIHEAEKLTGWSLNTSMGAPLVDFCNLTEDEIEELAKMPETVVLENNKQIFLMKHQMPLNEKEIAYLETKKNKEIIVLSAHTHEPNYGAFKNMYFFNPGSVGLTDNGRQGAYFGILNHGKLIHSRIDYDYEKTIEELRKIDILYSRCENWGTLLEYSLRGVNANALYSYEKGRIKKILKKLPPETIEKLRTLKGKELHELIEKLVPILTKEEKPFATCLTTDFNPFGGYINATTYVSQEENGEYVLKRIIHDIENFAVNPSKESNNTPQGSELPEEVIQLVNAIAHEYVKKYVLEYANEVYISETRKKS